MSRYIIRQLLSVIPIILGVTVFVFILMHLAPGDPARLLAPEVATEADIEAIRVRLGLDHPIHVQYWTFISGLVRGDLGTSFVSGEPVLKELLDALPATLELALTALFIAGLVAFPIGVVSALKRNTVVDNVSMSGALLGLSIPNFWLGLLLILLFGATLQLLPISGRITYEVQLHNITKLVLVDSILTRNWEALVDGLRHLIMPAVALSGGAAAAWSRLIRSSMLDVIRSDYIRTARAKGLSGRVVVWKHALRPSLIPVITFMGIQVRHMLGGAIIVERVFGFPGLGTLLMRGVNFRDYFLVLGVVTMYSITAVLVNLIVDIAYVFVDPRVRFS
ncbi:MAG: ABC transporter permease [Bacillota bacterium]